MNRAILWLLLAALTLAKVLIAIDLALFGDEVFYWLESRHLALAYSDLPGMTAWLVALGVWTLGDSTLGVRFVFILLGLLLAWLIIRSAPTANNGTGRDAVPSTLLVYLCLPPFALMGLFAVPDVPMLVAVALLAFALPQALRTDRLTWWLLAGLALAIGLASHYRFGISAAGALAYFIFDRTGRHCWRKPGFYLMGAIAAIGLLPMLWFNLSNEAAAVRFQLLDRHPWQPQLEGALLGLKQFILLTPLLCAGLIITGLNALRSEDSSQRLLGWLSVVPAMILLTLGVFADQRNINFHWLLAAWLPLLPYLAQRLALWPGRWRRIALGTGGLSTIVLLVWIAAIAQSTSNATDQRLYGGDNFAGWSTLATKVAATRGDRDLLADNFIVASQLTFLMPDHPRIRVMDHRINSSYGRTVQLALWGDRLSTENPFVGDGLLVVEESARKLLELPQFYQSLCAMFESVRFVDQHNVLKGKKRFVFLEVSSEGPASCQLPPVVYLDHPRRNSTYSRNDLIINGWVVPSSASVDVVIDDINRHSARLGFDAQGAPEENAGFRLRVPEQLLTGQHQLRLEVSIDGNHFYRHRTIDFELRD